MGLEIVLRSPYEFSLFSRGDTLSRRAECTLFSIPDLNKDQRILLFHDDVNLAQFAAVVSLQAEKAALLKVTQCKQLCITAFFSWLEKSAHGLFGHFYLCLIRLFWGGFLFCIIGGFNG